MRVQGNIDIVQDVFSPIRNILDDCIIAITTGILDSHYHIRISFKHCNNILYKNVTCDVQTIQNDVSIKTLYLCILKELTPYIKIKEYNKDFEELLK